MEKIPFYKMSGAGNDFIVIDNREGIVSAPDLPAFVARVCRRKMSVGADGLFLLEPSDQADFKWQFFNSDGSVAEMCGNGARCVSRFAWLTGMTGPTLSFETLAGIISATVNGDQVKIRMTDPHDLVLQAELNLSSGLLACSRVNTGVPHVVIEVKDIETVDVFGLGREIRRHPDFIPAGTNVNFIAPLDQDLYAIRTYERGVEDETLACGTGNTAAALVLAAKYGLPSPVTFRTRSKSLLKVHFTKDNGSWSDVYLEGDARVVYVGEMGEEA
ncbi:MAG: diaminopimelate epimerase, partial [Desulfosarcinaceae bacterium]